MIGSSAKPTFFGMLDLNRRIQVGVVFFIQMDTVTAKLTFINCMEPDTID